MITSRSEQAVSLRFPLLRGLILVLCFTWGVWLVSLAISVAGNAAQLGALMSASFSIALLWGFLFLPHSAIFPHPFSEWTGIELALSQWVIAGLIVGHLTRSMSNRRTLSLAFIAIAALSLAVHALIRVVGYRVVMQLP